MAKHCVILLFLLSFVSQMCAAQRLPESLKKHLDSNYRGWKLAGECYEKKSENTQFVAGDFDGNGLVDYAVKFVSRNRGFFVAFLAKGTQWKPFNLHIWKDANGAKFSNLILFKKGEQYVLGESNFKLKFDAPADFRCESDVGGIHVYKNGKFVAY